MKNRNSKKGFTLVEIMIVVVIIGLLAAMAIPAFQKVRVNSVGKAMDNDARQLASAAQQYFLEKSATVFTISSYDSSTGVLTGDDVTPYVRRISKGYSGTPGTITADQTFTMTHPVTGGAVTYSSEGQRTGN